MIAVAAIAVLVFLPVGQTLSNRASGTVTGGDNSAKFRLAYDHASVKIWHLAPLTGVGLGDDRYYNPSLVHLSFLPNANTEFQNVNTYLGVLSESGVFGLLLLSVMLLALVLPLGRVRREGAWVTEAPILLCIVAFFFLNFYAYPILWFFVGARLAHVRQLERLGESTQQQAERPELMTA
jgi:O-antigen ligase